MANEQQSGSIKNVFDKATDTVGGAVGQMGAAMTETADSFVEKAAIGDKYEIKASEIALKRSSSDEVRAIARKLIDDHTTSTHKLHSALEQSAGRDVAHPPQGLDSRRQSMIQHLEEASDADFDSTYLDQQLLAHEEAVSLMHSYRDSGDNAPLRSYASEIAPVVEGHLEAVKRARFAS